ncbi:MAG TPA: hypothetical protein VHE61_21580 [Opitutaceae bacterium]|nr:hypothetical protein [Opitutaceae bacterium]
MIATATPAEVPLHKRKRTYLWALVAVGPLNGVLYSYGLSHLPSQMGLELFMVFTFNLALLGWCYADSEQRLIPITRYLGLALLAAPIIGVPWYFVRSRGGVSAAKSCFGFGLIGLYLLVFVLSFTGCEAITGQLV